MGRRGGAWKGALKHFYIWPGCVDTVEAAGVILARWERHCLQAGLLSLGISIHLSRVGMSEYFIGHYM